MKDQTLLMQISAFADGELAPAQARALEARLGADASLSADVALYRRLKLEAAALPVPSMDACLRKKSGAMISPTAGAADKLAAQIGQALATDVPRISAERFNGVWEKIASRTVRPPAENEHQIRISAYFDNALSGSERLQAEADFASEMMAGRAPEEQLQTWKKLDECAATLSAPLVSDLAWSELWHEIGQRTVELSAAERARIARIESSAAALPVPQISQDRWGDISGRVLSLVPELAAVPQVSDERWGKVWQGVATRIQPAAVSKSASPAPVRIQKVDFAPAPKTQRHWGWAAAAGMAAVAMFALLLNFVSQPPGNDPEPVSTQLAMHIPEVLDDRYEQVQVEYLPGQQEPVLCFFLKNEESNENEQQKWEWMPN